MTLGDRAFEMLDQSNAGFDAVVAGWTAVAGRTPAFFVTNNPSPGYTPGVGLDANHTPAGVGVMLLATPRFTVEAGNRYRLTLGLFNLQGAETTQVNGPGGVLILPAVTAPKGIVAADFVPTAGEGTIELRSTSVVATRPLIYSVRVEKVSTLVNP